MNVRVRGLLLVAWLVLEPSGVARAGMPAITLTDLARMRFQTLSFFLVGLLVCAGVVQWVWNELREDFPRLPRLSFGRAMGLITLWGLLFVLVLTMISGARELMTPGAWTKVGLTYKLAEPPPGPVEDRTLSERRAALDRLRIALWTYARSHDGRFPEGEAWEALPAEVWSAPDPSGMRYRYAGGLVAGEGHAPLAWEPELFGAERLVLQTDGRIVLMRSDEIGRTPGAGGEP